MNINKEKQDVANLINSLLDKLEYQEIESIDVNKLIISIMLKKPVGILFIIKFLKVQLNARPNLILEGDLDELNTIPYIYNVKIKKPLSSELEDAFKGLETETAPEDDAEDKTEDE